jgi:hypothetical protein
VFSMIARSEGAPSVVDPDVSHKHLSLTSL